MQARFALRPTAPMFARARRRRPPPCLHTPAADGPASRDEAPHRRAVHARCSHRVWRAYGATARVLPRAAAARSSLRGRRFLASARPMVRLVSQLSALLRHACSHSCSPRSRCCGERTVRACPSRGSRPPRGASRFAAARHGTSCPHSRLSALL